MPRGSRPGSAPGLNRSRDLLAPSSSPNSACAIFPSAAGSVKHAPGLAAKPLLDANCCAGAGNSALIESHGDLVAKFLRGRNLSERVATPCPYTAPQDHASLEDIRLDVRFTIGLDNRLDNRLDIRLGRVRWPGKRIRK